MPSSPSQSQPRFLLMVLMVSLGAGVVVHSAATEPAAERCKVDAVAAIPAAAATDDLAGIWRRFEVGPEGSALRFYYFHGNGKGLYRYGRVGLNNTHSFDYSMEGDTLRLHFRKSGIDHEVPFTVTREDGRDWLVLAGDPEEGGATRYFRDEPGPIDPHGDWGAAFANDGPAPSGHMWIDHRRHATGGAAFAFYQFRPSGIDGRGVGWFHRGDFDDWSTETLTYRIIGDDLSLHFTLADTHAITTMAVEPGNPRVLNLAEDPRDFWAGHRYEDAGPSFGGGPTQKDEGPTDVTADPRFVAALAGAR